MNHQHHAVMNTISTKEQFNALMAEAEAEAVIGEFGSDERLEARISREYGDSTGGCYC
jgi:hypothetical protein